MSSSLLFNYGRRDNYLLVALAVCIIIGGVAAFPLSYFSGANCIVGLCILPFAFFRTGRARFNWVYLGAIIFFGTLAFAYHMRVFYFLGLAAYVLFVVELFFGGISPLILFLVMLLCPIFSQVVGILGFPIRLHLSQWAGGILQWIGQPVTVEGNIMTLNGSDFAVDEACMGLNMIVISFLMGIFVIVYEYRATGLRLSFKVLFGYFICVFVLNIFSNLMRIISLVMFAIPADNPWHEIVGILCLAFYVMIPLYFLARTLIRFYGVKPPVLSYIPSPHTGYKLICGALGLSAMCIGFTIKSGRAAPVSQMSNIQLGGMKGQFIGDGVTKFNNDEVLVYIKDIPQFFTSEHTPLFCWRGSGYQLKKITKMEIEGLEVYTGVLEKQDEKLYTAWWYYNGTIHTIDQFTWRRVMLTGGKGFSLVNITASSESVLMRSIQNVLEKKQLTFTDK